MGDRLHDKGDGGQDRAIPPLRFRLVAAAHGFVDLDLCLEAVGGGNQAGAAGAQIVRQFQPAAAVQHGQAGRFLHDALDQRGGAFRLQHAQVGVAAGHLPHVGGGQAQPHQVRGVLQPDRYAQPVDDGAEEAHQLGFRHAGARGRLQDQPVGTQDFRFLRGADLIFRRVAEDRDGQRKALAASIGQIRQRPLDHLAAFSRGQLADLGRQSQHGQAVRAAGDAGPDLAAHGIAVQCAVRTEEGVQDGMDAVEHGGVACHRSSIADHRESGL